MLILPALKEIANHPKALNQHGPHGSKRQIGANQGLNKAEPAVNPIEIPSHQPAEQILRKQGGVAAARLIVYFLAINILIVNLNNVSSAQRDRVSRLRGAANCRADHCQGLLPLAGRETGRRVG